MLIKKSMGWSQLTKCRALKVRHLVPETDPLIQIKNKEKIMKNLVPNSIKYSSMSSFTYSSYPIEASGIRQIICMLRDDAKGETEGDFREKK